MLKRQQVLINSWLTDHIKEVAEKYDISYSEMIRVLLCNQVLRNTAKVLPNENIPNLEKELDNIIKKRNSKDEYDSEELHNYLSKLYFETRKTVEIWNKKHSK